MNVQYRGRRWGAGSARMGGMHACLPCSQEWSGEHHAMAVLEKSKCWKRASAGKLEKKVRKGEQWGGPHRRVSI